MSASNPDITALLGRGYQHGFVTEIAVTPCRQGSMRRWCG
jgi:hypothetical protein